MPTWTSCDVSTFTEAALADERGWGTAQTSRQQTADRTRLADSVLQLLLGLSYPNLYGSACRLSNSISVIDFDPSFRLLTDETCRSPCYQEVWQELMIVWPNPDAGRKNFPTASWSVQDQSQGSINWF